MIRLLALLLFALLLALLLFPVPAFAQWDKASIYLRIDDRATILGTALHLMPGPEIPAPYQWHQKDLSPQGVPKKAIAVFVSGLLIVTHGNTAEVCNLTIAFRAPGSLLDASLYLGQTVEAHTLGGQRSGFSGWVPVRNGMMEYQYRTSTPNDWPEHCAYGITLALQAYAR